MQFQSFQKIPRLYRKIIITEKLDGSNAQIVIEKGQNLNTEGAIVIITDENGEMKTIRAGSRNRWLTLEDDNYGFASWVCENCMDLLKLGEGRHSGEWWGSGINRRYGFNKGERFFSLFNTIRWCEHDKKPQPILTDDPRIVKTQDVLPSCCSLVPVLYEGDFCSLKIRDTLEQLRETGSQAAPGFKSPEGIVVYHTAANTCFKVTLEKDDEYKSK